MINIDNLTEAELIDLNHRVVARLNFLQQMKAHAHMLDFSVGERVAFQPDGQPVIFGIITKYNRKTVSVLTESGQQWNVSPGFLRKTVSSSEPEPPAPPSSTPPKQRIHK